MVKLGVVGGRKTGKTTVIEGLIAYLRREGFRVATVKHTSHSHRFDTPGKDSYRHREAGAGLTVAISGREIALFAKPDVVTLPQIERMAESQFDIWLVEGDRQAVHPKILVTSAAVEPHVPDNAVATIGSLRIPSIPSHFEAGDYAGLGSFVIRTFLRKP